jgi:hypothetical protein
MMSFLLPICLSEGCYAKSAFCQIFADRYISEVFAKKERKFIHYSELRNKDFLF